MKRIVALLLFGMLFAGLPAAAQTPATVKLCIPTTGTACPLVTAAAPLPVTIISGGSGGTSSTFGAAFPSLGTAVGFTDGTNMVAGRVRNPGSGALVGDAAIVVADPNLLAAVNSAIPAGSAIIGKVGIDQTTPGTTNGVQVNAALPAGANLIGKTGIDQTTPGTTNGVQVNAALPAGTNLIGKFGIDQTTPGTTNAVAATGNVAAAATDSGNPVKIGGKYNATPPAVTDGQRADWQLNARGFGYTLPTQAVFTGTDAVANTALGQPLNQANGTVALLPINGDYVFGGSTWERQFACSSTAVVNVTAGNTTEIVALTASQVVRVCSFTASMSLAGTAQFVYGTGTNCGTGTTNLTGAVPLAASAPWSMGGGNGSVFRTASANALCVAAVTGNVVGFVTYAKY